MVLPLLFSLGLPALASTGALGATLGALSTPALAGIGAGLGGFVETGDLSDGIKTGMTAFVGGKILNGLTSTASTTSTNALNAGASTPTSQTDGFLKTAFSKGIPATEIAAGAPSPLVTKFLGTETANAPFGTGTGTKGGALTAGQQGFMPGMIGQTMTDMQLMQQADEDREAEREANKVSAPMLNPMRRTFNSNPYAGGFGEANYFDYQRPPRADGSTPKYPYYYAGGGILALAEGGEANVDAMMEDNGMNEKDVIVGAIAAVKGMSEQPEIALAMFVQKYGEDALRDLVEKVQSGEYDDTVARFAAGEKGMVKGPGDGSGKDDMIPATLDGQQDVLLTEDEFVLRQPTTKAIEKAFGGGFLDRINEAEEDAPKVLERMVG